MTLANGWMSLLAEKYRSASPHNHPSLKSKATRPLSCFKRNTLRGWKILASVRYRRRTTCNGRWARTVWRKCVLRLGSWSSTGRDRDQVLGRPVIRLRGYLAPMQAEPGRSRDCFLERVKKVRGASFAGFLVLFLFPGALVTASLVVPASRRAWQPVRILRPTRLADIRSGGLASRLASPQRGARIACAPVPASATLAASADGAAPADGAAYAPVLWPQGRRADQPPPFFSRAPRAAWANLDGARRNVAAARHRRIHGASRLASSTSAARESASLEIRLASGLNRSSTPPLITRRGLPWRTPRNPWPPAPRRRRPNAIATDLRAVGEREARTTPASLGREACEGVIHHGERGVLAKRLAEILDLGKVGPRYSVRSAPDETLETDQVARGDRRLLCPLAMGIPLHGGPSRRWAVRRSKSSPAGEGPDMTNARNADARGGTCSGDLLAGRG